MRNNLSTAARSTWAAVFFALSTGLGSPLVEAQEKAAEPITVVFYNLKNYLSMDRRIDGEVIEAAPKPEKEIRPLISALREIQPDVLGVCEIGDISHLNDFQARLKAAGVDLPESELVTAASGFNRNLALLSRFPIIARNSRDDYTYNIGDLKLPFQRGVLDVTLKINPQYHLRYVALHLKSKRDIPEADQAVMRLNEARLAREHIDRIFEKEPGVNLLVTGDFNDLRIEPPIKTLQGRFGRKDYLTSLMLDDKFGFRWTHHWGFADSYSRFDYMLYSKGINREIDRDKSHIFHWDDWDKASDHRPLVVHVVPVDEKAAD